MSSINRYQERIAELEAELATERALCDRLAEALRGVMKRLLYHKPLGFDRPEFRQAGEALDAYRAAREQKEETR